MEMWIKSAGLVQLFILAGNFIIIKKLDCIDDTKKLSLINRQVFQIHYIYILLMLAGFGFLCLSFPAELAGTTALGRSFSGFLAFFWGSRALIQLFYYDPKFKKANRIGHVIFCLCFIFLASVFSFATWGDLL